MHNYVNEKVGLEQGPVNESNAYKTKGVKGVKPEGKAKVFLIFHTQNKNCRKACNEKTDKHISCSRCKLIGVTQPEHKLRKGKAEVKIEVFCNKKADNVNYAEDADKTEVADSGLDIGFVFFEHIFLGEIFCHK